MSLCVRTLPIVRKASMMDGAPVERMAALNKRKTAGVVLVLGVLN